MKGYLAAMSALTLLATVGLANAEEATGKIKEVDKTAGTFILEDGSDFKLAEGVSMDGVEPGMEVQVSFEAIGMDMLVDKITLKEKKQ